MGDGPRNLAANAPDVAAAISKILDRHEALGRAPGRVTVEVSEQGARALAEIFTARAVVSAGPGRVRIDVGLAARTLGRGAAWLMGELYRALSRVPRDRRAEDRATSQELDRALAGLAAGAATDASRAFISAERAALAVWPSGPGKQAGFLAVISKLRTAAATKLASDVIRCMDAAITNREPIRIQSFAARVLGSSKALGPAGELLRIVSAALYWHDARTRGLVSELGDPPSLGAAESLAFEANGIYRDEAAASVLCFGPIVYAKGRERFDHVARHAARGESSRLIAQQLRGASVERPAAHRITVVENLTPYLDYVDACVERCIADEIVICSGGQASWAVVMLLERLAAHAIPVRHAGDLDRAGVLILRSLAKRSGARIEPLFMDVETHRTFRELAAPISDAELGRLDQLLAGDPPGGTCHELLVEMAATRVWTEQEAFFDQIIGEALDHAACRARAGPD